VNIQGGASKSDPPFQADFRELSPDNQQRVVELTKLLVKVQDLSVPQKVDKCEKHA
jgi:hypothetical protein